MKRRNSKADQDETEETKMNKNSQDSVNGDQPSQSLSKWPSLKGDRPKSNNAFLSINNITMSRNNDRYFNRLQSQTPLNYNIVSPP